eukprot:758172-Pyramimonas_sp.AAC.1
MHSAAAGVDPEEALETKVVPQPLIDDLDGDGHQRPAFVADVSAGAAGAHVVVVRHVLRDVRNINTLKKGEQWEKVGSWTQGEKRGRVSG